MDESSEDTIAPTLKHIADAAGVSVASALQFRSVVRGLGDKEIPRGYWLNLGVWLNFALAIVALALAVHFVTSG